MKRAVTASVLIAILIVSAVGITQDRSFKVIGHESTTPDTVSKRLLGRVFLKRVEQWPDGREAVPVDQKGNDELRSAFYMDVLDRTISMIESYWQAQVFSGRSSPPLAIGSDAEIIEFVRTRPGAVGYISSSARAEGIKVINVQD
jgi:hypothetical protein